MPLDFNKGGSRYGRTTKRKKNNMVLNILIGIVFIFIVVLASSLFFGKNDRHPFQKINWQQMSKH